MNIGDKIRIKKKLISDTLSQTGIVKEFLYDKITSDIWCNIDWTDGSNSVVKINDLDFIKYSKLNFNSIW